MNTHDPELLRRLTAVLAAGGIEDAALEAKWITEDTETPAQAEEIAKRRAKHEPLQYLLGAWEFYGLKFAVGGGVLIPRADTETLVDAVLSRVKSIKQPRIADLCTGSACIALALAAHLPAAEITGIELNSPAMAYAQKNRTLHHAENVQLLQADVLDPQTAAAFSGLDVIVSNPPYLTAEDMAHLQEEVRYEPAAALDGGEDGLHFYREITKIWRGALKNGGLLAFEIGSTQAAAVAAILTGNGFTGIETVKDLCGNDRAVLGYMKTVK